jgi:TonB-dependent SusC/RagA subfamily outer membrane receptor
MRIKAFLFIVLSFLATGISSGQKNNSKFIINGLVTDAQKKPLVGALILIDGKNNNLVTDNKGLYKIKVRPDADSITIVTFTNGISTVAINGRTNINFVLGESGLSKTDVENKQTNDKKVDVGYGDQNQKDVMTPVNTIDARNSKYATYKSIYEILKGTPGVIVKGNSVQIQGQSSINSGTEPLYVVDGMVVESVDGIPPAMVESISVLKGASASIYGSRGANGVILVSLIRGSQNGKK